MTGETQIGQILTSLLQNAQYRAYFTSQIERHLAGALDTAAVRERLAALAAELRPDIAAEAARWRPDEEPAVLVEQWEAELQRISDSLDAERAATAPVERSGDATATTAPAALGVGGTGTSGTSRLRRASASPRYSRRIRAQRSMTRGRYSDWLELHNPTATPVSLVGYTLTDDPTQPTRWALPITTLAPGAFLVIWASGEDLVTRDSWYTSFRLSCAGGYVGLFGPDGQVADEVTFGPQLADVSLGRLTGSNQWVAFPNPTPGTANATPPRAAPGAPPVVVTPGSGFFAGPVTVHLQAPVGRATVHYTLDGTDPTVDGQAYTAPVAVTETTVLRAVALHDGVPVSTVTTATYLVGEPDTLPVVSLVTDPAHLWDEATGISTNTQQRGRRWERPVTVQELSPEGELGFSVPAGLRIRGGVGRPEAAKQSFELYFRERNMGCASWPIRCLGRSRGRRMPGWCCETRTTTVGSAAGPRVSGGDAVYVRGQLVRDLHGAMGQVAVRGRWVALYLNGASWGLYHLTEYALTTPSWPPTSTASAWYTSTPTLENRRPTAPTAGTWLRNGWPGRT